MDQAEKELRDDIVELSKKHAGRITSVGFASHLIGVCGLALSKIPGDKESKLAIFDEMAKQVRGKLEAAK